MAFNKYSHDDDTDNPPSSPESDGSKYIYRIMADLKVETDIITSIAVSPIGWTVILVKMYVETFKTDVNVFYI